MTVRVVEDSHVLEQVGTQLDDLHAATRVPVTARRAWLQAWFDSQPRYRPVALVVDGPAGRLDAAAVLAVHEGADTSGVVVAGHRLTDMSALPARDSRAAERLARGVADLLQETGGRWQLTLRLVREEDEATSVLASLLPRSAFVQGDVSPVLRAGAGDTLRDHVSRNHWGQSRSRLNRMRREGLEPRLDHLTRPDEIAGVMPELESVLRARDLDVGRPCMLDDPVAGPFFRRVVESHAASGAVCLTTLRLSGQLAGYTLCFVDGDAHRMWNNRFDPRWARLSPGMVTIDAAVSYALESGSSDFDFMRGTEPYKDSYANDRLRTHDLFAWSGALRAARGRALLMARDAASRAEQSGGAAARVVQVARGAAGRVTSP